MQLRKLEYKDIAKKLYISEHSKENIEQLIDEKLDELEEYFLELKKHADYLKKLNTTSINYFQGNYGISGSHILVTSFPRSHSEFTLRNADQYLEEVEHNARIILDLIEKVKKDGVD